jgi:DNA-directed RNA polymerase specialized sigma24 family protein
VLLEQQRAPMTSPLEEIADLAGAPVTQADEHESLLECFDACLETMAPEERSVLTQYYEGEQRAKILNRRRLATALGVSENALRIRMRRFRDKLEQCVQTCIAQRAEAS